jgi:hypothetical protein
VYNFSGGFSTISGGVKNKIRSDTSFIGGGVANLVDLASSISVVDGGIDNTITNSFYGFIGGGTGNSIRPASSGNISGCTIAGGAGNTILGAGGFIGGGDGNAIGTNGYDVVIAGGNNNNAGGSDAAIPGGANNVASGQYSFAAGSGAMATNDYSFVWSDGTGNGGFGNGTAMSTAPHQFIIGALGGAAINTQPTTNNEGTPCALTAKGGITTDELDMPNPLGLLTTAGNIICSGQMNATIGTFNSQLSVAINTLQVTPGTVTVNGTFNNSSDRNAKQDFAPVSDSQILDKVAQLPISEWSYKVDAATRHIGPMAQDFYAAFDIGTDERHIAPIDEGGVALAAIQGLNQKLEEKNARIQEQAGEIAELNARLEKLEQLVSAENKGNR